MQTLGDRLRAAMSTAGVSQAQLARATGVKAPSVNGWLSGKSKFLRGENLLKAAVCLKVQPKWLAEGVGPRAADAVEAPPPPAAVTVAQALPIALEALRQAPPLTRTELAQVLGLLVTTGNALYAQRVVELMASEQDLPPVRLTPEERERAQRLTDAAHESAKLDLTKHGRRTEA